MGVRSEAVSCAGVDGVVAPAGKKMLGVTVNLVVSLLVSATVRPPDGAGIDKLTGNSAEPSPSESKTGRMMVAGVPPTMTVAIALAIPVALAVIFTGPPTATPVTGTFTLVVPCAKVTLAGAVATAVLLEFRLTVRPPAGAGPERLSERFCVAPGRMVTGPDGKPIVVVTWTCWLADPRPDADAVMVAGPKLTPVTFGVDAEVVIPCEIIIFAGDTVTFVGSLLTSEMNTPPAGAAVPKVTGKFSVSPGINVIAAGRIIGAGLKTVMVAVALARLGPLAVIVAEPVPIAVTGTLTLILFAGMVTVGGTVATPGLLELRLIVCPPAGAAADKLSVRFCVVPAVIVALAGEKLSAASEVTCTCPMPGV